MALVRIVRVLEYVGERAAIEKHFQNVVHGTRSWGQHDEVIVLRAATLGSFPEILEEDKPV